MRTDLLKAAIKRYDADMEAAWANVRTYMENSVGIGEHPDLVEAVQTQIEKYAEAKELKEAAEEMLEWHED